MCCGHQATSGVACDFLEFGAVCAVHATFAVLQLSLKGLGRVLESLPLLGSSRGMAVRARYRRNAMVVFVGMHECAACTMLAVVTPSHTSTHL